MLKKISLTFLGLLALTAVSYAGGSFQGFPLVGGDGATNCLSFGNNGVCNQYQPAGPAVVPPGSTFPADTNIQGGGSNANPSTVNIPVTSIGLGSIVVTTSPATATIANGTNYYILNGAQGSAFTLTTPSAPTPNQLLTITCQAATVGALTVAANTGQTLANNPAAACVAGVVYAWVWDATNATWRRAQ